MEIKRLEIDNSAEAAVKSGKWKNPGSSFYYKILNSFRILDESKDDEDIDKYDFDFRKVLKEAYLIAPVEKIKNSPYGITPYSQSGCKYPHHVIKNGKLVVSVPGIQAAYARAKQQGIFKGDVKSHIEKHYKELGLDMSTMTECVDPIQEEIDLNFDFIQKHIESTLGVKFVHDDVMMESVDDIVDKEQYIKETFDWMDEILYESDEEYNRKIDEENELNESDIEEIDFEEKYSAIDATESEWNEFWSLFEQNRLHKSKSHMLNYYNQYLEYIESMSNSSSDDIMKAHQYKEKIDEMSSDPEYNFSINIYDTRGLTYANHRREQLIPISDEEFINESLDIKSYMLNLLSLNENNAAIVERYNNEIAYLIECKYSPSIKLDRDSVNWEYMNLLEHGFDDTGFNMKRRRENWSGYRYPSRYEMPMWLSGVDIPQLLKSYNLLERSNITSDQNYSYQIGIDTDSGKLVCVKFNLVPRRNDGPRIIHKDGKLISVGDSVNDIVTRAGHIDSVSGSDTVDSIMYRDNATYNEDGTIVHMIPIESEEVREVLGKIYNYDSDLMKKFIIMSNDTNDGFILSLSDAFADPKVQSLFIAFVNQFKYQPIEHEVGKQCGSNVYDCTYIPWDPISMYQRFGDAPKFTGPISNTFVKVMGRPSFIDDASFEYKELYNLNELDNRLNKIRDNIKKYEEAVQEYISTSNQFNINLSSYLEADGQSEENDQVEDDDTPPNIDLGDEEIESDEPPTIDTDESESTEEDTPSEDEVQEDISDAPDIIEPTSLPKATDAQEENKNGVRRKKLYIAFIEWAKSYNQKNTFGSIFDKDAFDVTYPFVPHEMRYFYRLANPILCVLSGSLTFFQVSELRKLNANNPDMKDALIFAATENDYRVFSTRDKKVYVGVDKEDRSGIAFTKCLADSFDLYIQNMIDQGDILNGPIASESDSNITDENNDSDKE